MAQLNIVHLKQTEKGVLGDDALARRVQLLQQLLDVLLDFGGHAHLLDLPFDFAPVHFAIKFTNKFYMWILQE